VLFRVCTDIDRQLALSAAQAGNCTCEALATTVTTDNQKLTADRLLKRIVFAKNDEQGAGSRMKDEG
jgi:hypothetical protein